MKTLLVLVVVALSNVPDKYVCQDINNGKTGYLYTTEKHNVGDTICIQPCR